MKILIIASTLSGGAGKAAYRLFSALSNYSSVDVKVLCLEFPHLEECSIHTFYAKQSTLFLKQLLFYPLTKYWKKSYYIKNNHCTSPRSIHLLESHPLIQWADIINLHWVNNFIDYKRFFGKVRKPILWTLHDMQPFSGGYTYDFYRQFLDPRSAKKIQLFKSRHLPSSDQLRIITPSKWLLAQSQQSALFSRYKHKVVRNTIQDNIYQIHSKISCRNILNLPLDKKILFICADKLTDKRKGVNILVEALKMFSPSEIHILLLGNAKMSDCNLPYSLTYLGYLHDDISLSLAYNAASVTIIPSIEDNLPNVALESLFCGCPVVGFKSGGLPEIVTNNKTGYIADEFSPQSLFRAISKSINRDWQQSEIRKSIKDTCSPQYISTQFIDICDKTISSIKDQHA